jgi:hypothetical protein
MKTWPYASRPVLAWIAITIYALLAFWGTLNPPVSGTIRTAAVRGGVLTQITDKELYRQVIAEVSAGHPYYDSVARLHRANGYPLQPAVTVRLPTLAVIAATLGQIPTFILYAGLIGGCIVAWSVRLRQLIEPSQRRELAPAVVLVAFLATASPVIVYFHEAWAGILIAFGLALWRPERLWPSVIAFFCAMLFREMAVCGVLVMLVMASFERRWKEAAVWTVAIIVFAGLMTFHVHAVQQVVNAGDMTSPGWRGLGSWPLVVSATTAMSFLIVVPRVIGAIMIPAMLLGWAAWRHPLAYRVLGVVIGYAIAIAVFSRRDTLYWALLFAPLLTVGLLFVPFKTLATGLRGQAAPRSPT